MEANNIEDGRKVAVLLSVIGTKYFSLIHSLVAPEKPKDKNAQGAFGRARGTLGSSTSSHCREISFLSTITRGAGVSLNSL